MVKIAVFVIKQLLKLGLLVYCVLCSVRLSRTQHGTQYTAWNTCYHNAAYHITMYFHWSSPQYCSFSKAQHTLPEDGPIGPKHVGVNKEIF